MTYFLQRDTRPWPAKTPDLDRWFPETMPEHAAEAVATVGKWGQQHFGPNITLQGGAGIFGLQLLVHSIPDRVSYCNLPDKQQKVLYATAFQHRMERFQNVPHQHAYDARLAYMASIRDVPVYTPDTFVDDEVAEYIPYRRGWYQVTAEVPSGWNHIGLVPNEDRIGISRRYPNTPGSVFRTWLSDMEMRLCQEHGWETTIQRRLLFAPPKTPGGDPLRNWGARLNAGIEKLDGLIANGHDLKAVRSGLRNVALHTIGHFHLNERLHSNGIDEAGELQWIQHTMTPWLQRFQHPEWAAYVWAYTRVKVTRLALSVPHSQVVEIRGDELFTTDPIPGLADTGKVGAYREKRRASNAANV